MKRYALVGTGGRGYLMYGKGIVAQPGDVAQLVALCDPNPGRSGYVRAQLSDDIPIYTDFDEMVREAKPDAVVVTTMDRHHAAYIRRAFALGCDVICEKPLAIDEVMCRDILDAEKEYGRKVAVTFNCRFMPFFARVKSMLQAKPLGEILSVDFEWLLDTRHGADYFRRWHRCMENSGGLLVHKATHHFDIVNWLIEQDPQTVSANGSLRYYGPTRAQTGERCLTCAYKATCERAFTDYGDPLIQGLYFNAEGYDHYYRDRCVFAKEIDIYDNMSLSVRYSGGALMTYSLIAYSPYEGWRMAINGTEGRMEIAQTMSGPNSQDPMERVCIYNRQGEQVTHKFKKGEGDHGGGDARLLRMLLEDGIPDPLGQLADSRAGVMSAMIGIAANVSIREGRNVSIASLLDRAI